MSQYVLVGGPFEIYDTPFNGESHLLDCVLGGHFELDDDQAKRSVLHGAALLPAEIFDSLGFTAEELRKYPNARFHPEAPPEFHQKFARALQALYSYRAQLAQES